MRCVSPVGSRSSSGLTALPAGVPSSDRVSSIASRRPAALKRSGVDRRAQLVAVLEHPARRRRPSRRSSPFCTCSNSAARRAARRRARATPSARCAASPPSMPISSVRAGDAALQLLDQHALLARRARRQEGRQVGAEMACARSHQRAERQREPATPRRPRRRRRRDSGGGHGVAVQRLARALGLDRHHRAVAVGELHLDRRAPRRRWPSRRIGAPAPRSRTSQRRQRQRPACAAPLTVGCGSSAAAPAVAAQRAAHRGRPCRQLGHAVQRERRVRAAALQGQRRCLRRSIDSGRGSACGASKRSGAREAQRAAGAAAGCRARDEALLGEARLAALALRQQRHQLGEVEGRRGAARRAARAARARRAPAAGAQERASSCQKSWKLNQLYGYSRHSASSRAT